MDWVVLPSPLKRPLSKLDEWPLGTPHRTIASTNDGQPPPAPTGSHRFDWAKTYDELSAADRSSSLTVEELELLARAAMLLGNMAQSVEVLSRAYQSGSPPATLVAAVRNAFGRLFNSSTLATSGRVGHG